MSQDHDWGRSGDGQSGIGLTPYQSDDGSANGWSYDGASVDRALADSWSVCESVSDDDLSDYPWVADEDSDEMEVSMTVGQFAALMERIKRCTCGGVA